MEHTIESQDEGRPLEGIGESQGKDPDAAGMALDPLADVAHKPIEGLPAGLSGGTRGGPAVSLRLNITVQRLEVVERRLDQLDDAVRDRAYTTGVLEHRVAQLEANYAEDQALGEIAPVSEGEHVVVPTAAGEWTDADVLRLQHRAAQERGAIAAKQLERQRQNDAWRQIQEELTEAIEATRLTAPCHHENLDWCGDCQEVECLECGATFVQAEPAQR